MKQDLAAYFGEFLGTFLLVFIGTSSVAVAVLFNALVGLMQVAAVWGLGVTLAIYATRHLSCAHLNPAVSLGMVLTGRMQPRTLFLRCRFFRDKTSMLCPLRRSPTASYTSLMALLREVYDLGKPLGNLQNRAPILIQLLFLEKSSFGRFSNSPTFNNNYC